MNLRTEPTPESVAAPIGVADHLMQAYWGRAPVPVALVSGAAHVLVFANTAFRQLTERAGGHAAVGSPVADALPSLMRDGMHAVLDQVRRDNVAVHDTYLGYSIGDVPRAHRATWRLDVWPVEQDAARWDGIVISVRRVWRREPARVRQRAITERLLFAALREQDLASHADRSRARAVFLAEASRRLVASRDLETVHATIAAVALPSRGAWSVVDVVQPDGSWQRLPIVHPDPAQAAAVRELAAHWSPAPGDPFGISLMAESGQPTIVDADSDAFLARAAHGPANLRLLQALGFGALLVVPLTAHDGLRGAITFVNPIGVPAYTAEDLQLAADLAARCADVLDAAYVTDGLRAARVDADSARKDAEYANQVKTSFLTSMSHELRTPLNAILGYTDLMAAGLRGPVTAEQLEALNRIQQASRHLLGLINNVLNFARLKALQVRFAISDGLVSDLLASATLMVEPQALVKGLVLVSVPCVPTLTVHGDQEKVRQILLNLLSNAVKFTGTGGLITLAATRVDRRRRAADTSSPLRSAAMQAVEFTVSDTGRGIAAEQIPKLFEPFVQVGRRLSGLEEGTGLGLAISRDLARAMGGDITLESTQGIGSTFRLTMPCGAPT